MTEPEMVRVYHGASDNYATVPRTALGIMARSGWIESPEEPPVEEKLSIEETPEGTEES
jgi:hypothetical protein